MAYIIIKLKGASFVFVPSKSFFWTCLKVNGLTFWGGKVLGKKLVISKSTAMWKNFGKGNLTRLKVDCLTGKHTASCFLTFLFRLIFSRSPYDVESTQYIQKLWKEKGSLIPTFSVGPTTNNAPYKETFFPGWSVHVQQIEWLCWRMQ